MSGEYGEQMDLDSDGYVVAALDHSEIAAPQFAAPSGATDEQMSARVEAMIANRVPGSSQI